MRRSLLLIAMAALLLGGCARSDSPPAQQGGIHAVIETTPKQPVAGAETTFRVTVTKQERDEEIAGADVAMYLEMKEMDHGENRVSLNETAEPGVYSGTGTFPMGGIWTAHVRASVAGETRTANVELKVKE
ncbi:FixH family protein [Tumebacillus sp. DT12]|uniref:FixH family protein n=1 Tax=Tumebacillus lacus TaxID=2995335 RepID=A0ABT3WVB9_9BACL|nr:FixH family protein [Tumebacillus lacus]MCX7568620.1 FixH family protein [Tumebacillus lacus]